MDGEFFEVVRAATAGSSQVRTVSESHDQSRVRKSGRTVSTTSSPLVRLQLIDDDGYLDWEETTDSPPSLSGFRSSRPTSSSKTYEAIELEFERLRPSKVTQFLATRDRKLTPHQGVRRFDPDSGKLVAGRLPDRGDVLLFVHGTFSNGENLLSGLTDEQVNPSGMEFLREAIRRFNGNVFTFDHPTLSVGPILNAIDLQRAIGESQARFRLVSHSRGGLVTRWWCETFDPDAQRCDRSVLVASPLSGTGLAAPPNIRDAIALLTQFSKALRLAAGAASLAVPVFSVVETLLRVVTSVTSLAAKTPVVDAAMAMVPGLSAMSRVGNNPELARLLDLPLRHADRYYAIKADFQPSDPIWKFWRLFRKENVINTAADVLFDGANDLVVDTTSMDDLGHRIEIPRERTLDFKTSASVHHLNYFCQPETARFLGDVLL